MNDGAAMGTSDEKASGGNSSIRRNLMLILAISLGIVLGGAATFVFIRTSNITSGETERSARDLAYLLADAVQTFGQTGDMTGMSIFLKNVEERGSFKEVHTIRSAATAADFKEREGAVPRDDVEKRVLETGTPEQIMDRESHTLRYVVPQLAKEQCLRCHNVTQDTVLGVESISVPTEIADRASSNLKLSTGGIFIAAIIVELILCFFVLTRSVIHPLTGAIKRLLTGIEMIDDTSAKVAVFSGDLSKSVNEQAASIEETSASLEEMTSMTEKNADSATQLNALADGAREAVQKGQEAMGRMSDAIERIRGSSDQTAKIVKTIEEIAFQTNLLALNAAVEAARAGDAGKGFAVVAEEVRNLARRSAEAAKNTAALIEESQRNAADGVGVSTEVGKMLEGISDSIIEVTRVVADVATSTREQSLGIGEINTALAHIDRLTQETASNTEEWVSLGNDLSGQAGDLHEMVALLSRLVGATSDNM